MIAWGKEFFSLQNKDVTHITYGILAANVLIIIYSINLFFSAIDIRKNVGNYINMVTEKDGNNLSNFLVIVGILSLPSNSLSVYLMYISLTSDISKKIQIGTLMYSLPFVILGAVCSMLIICVMVLTHIYSQHVALHDGITEAMNNYSSNSEFKTTIDKLQLQFDCCGSKHYNEWYNIVWYDSNLNNKKNSYQQSTPFSCCSKRSTYICIHHGIESGLLPYRYAHDLNFSISPFGCTTAIQQKKKSTGWSVIGRIFLLIILQLVAAAGIRHVQQIHFKDNEKNTNWFNPFQKKRKKKSNNNEEDCLVEAVSTGTESY